ncbi:Nn.00g106980.m01.CDS01 [Neocucurbitaria sp. VM-36]
MAFPLLFTLPPSNRHEIILLDTSSKPNLKSLNKQITSTIAASPNCAEFMGKYKSADAPQETIQEFKIHWDTKTRDGKIWPEYTVVTDDNIAAVLELLKGNPTMGVLEIKVGKSE